MQTTPVNCTKAFRLEKVKPANVKHFPVVLELARLECLKLTYSPELATCIYIAFNKAAYLCKHLLPLQTGTRKEFMTLCPPNKGHRTLLLRQQGNMEATGQPDQCTWACSKVEGRASFSPLAYSKDCLSTWGLVMLVWCGLSSHT